MNELETCEICRFWGEESHRCHRYAPRPTAGGNEDRDEELTAVWAVTKADDWCGDYEPHWEPEHEEEMAHAEREEKEDEDEGGDWAADGSPSWP